jgi:hypothetical protein
MRRRLPWLAALPLMAAGSLAAHGLSRLIAPARVAGEGQELAERSSTGVAAHSVVVLGIVGALVGFVCARWLLVSLLRRPRRGASPWLFFWLPPLAFGVQELFERLLHAEAAPFQAALEPRFLIGLALQLPFGLVALLVACVLLRVASRIARAFSRRPHGPRRRPSVLACLFVGCELPRIPALALGYPQRGPPTL